MNEMRIPKWKARIKRLTIREENQLVSNRIEEIKDSRINQKCYAMKMKMQTRKQNPLNAPLYEVQGLMMGAASSDT
jgi:hypothetical protein